MTKFTILITILSRQFSSVKYIYIVAHSMSRTLFILQNWNAMLIKQQIPIPASS